VEQLTRRQLAVEDVAAEQAVLVLHLVRPDHLPVQDRSRESRRNLLDAGDHPVGVRVELRAPFGHHVFARVSVRHPLREHRHHVLARGRK